MIADPPRQPWTFKLLVAALGVMVGLSLAWVETVTDPTIEDVHVASVVAHRARLIEQTRTATGRTELPERYAGRRAPDRETPADRIHDRIQAAEVHPLTRRFSHAGSSTPIGCALGLRCAGSFEIRGLEQIRKTGFSDRRVEAAPPSRSRPSGVQEFGPYSGTRLSSPSIGRATGTRSRHLSHRRARSRVAASGLGHRQ